MALCASAPYLPQLQQLLSGKPIAWGAQDVSAHESGAYTGESAAGMLKEFDVRYALVGQFTALSWSVVLACSIAFFVAALWGYDPQRGWVKSL